jgi:F-type H+-transporting ATPase subunit alpha
MVEVLKQPQYGPLPVEKQIAIIYAGTSGFLDELPVAEVQRFEEGLYAFLDGKRAAVLKEIREKKEMTEDLKLKLDEALEAFKTEFKKTLETK